MDEFKIDERDARDHLRAGGRGPAVPIAAAIVVIAAAAAALIWYLRAPDGDQPAPRIPAESEQSASTPDATAPRFPLQPALPDRSRPENLRPLPSLDDSDAYFELELSDVFGAGIKELLVDDALIAKFVATIDNLPGQAVAERIRPVGRLSEPFAVDGQDGSDEYTMNPSNYDRYDLLVTMLARTDRDALVDVYRRFYPLFQQAYAELGYPDGYFNDRVVEVIDHLLATPVVEEPVRLVRPNVLYEYEDPELEALSAGQKLLIRMGSEHRLRVSQFLEEIRERITTAQ
jgi:hypothetical protein